MAETAKDLKIKRRTAKAKLTRCSKALQLLLDSDRGVKEVQLSYSNLEDAFNDVQNAHDAYGELLDDSEFESEECWMDEILQAFTELQMKVKDYEKAMEGHSDARIGSTSSTPSACKVQVERPKLPRFKGDVREYGTFRSDFRHLIDSRYDKRDAIVILRTCLEGKALDLIKSTGNNYDDAWEQLDSIYGDPRFVADAIMYDLSRFKPLKEGEDSRYCDLVHLVKQSYNTLEQIGKTEDINNSHMLALKEKKLSIEDRKIWFRQQSGTQAPSFLDLLKWLSDELKTRLRATAPLRSGKSSTSSVSHIAEEGMHAFTSNHTSTSNPTARTPDFKCWLCKSNEHWIDKCSKVISKSQQERFILMKNNHACYSCLKRAGKDHNMNTCRRRKRCNKENCSSFHHPLLHRETEHTSTVDVASVSGDKAILPVINVKILGPRTSTVGSCLLDSGAQISIIKQSVADDLGLRGKPIKIDIGKVGGDTETVNSKLYQMRIRSVDGQKAFTIEAVGLEKINDNIAAVEIEELAKVFHLDKTVLHRSGGSIDLLVGVDYAKLQAGKTKQEGDLVARCTPLGWVVFGATCQMTMHGMHDIMNIQIMKNPVDLQDFWTTEAMGVCSRQEHDEQKLIRNSCEKVGRQWLVPYPWRKDPATLPDNRQLVEKMLQATEKKLAKNPQHAEAYNKQIQEMVEMGFARKLTDDELKSYNGPVHYIPHHAVIRPEKKSTPIRIVFNSSARYQGESLNDFWMKGPDLLNTLFGVILRFREKHVGLCADISKMYHRVLIPPSDQQVHRFLWRNLRPDKPPDVYVMKVVTFGDKPAPAMAQTALRRTAEEGRGKYPEAATVISRDTYMDDICTSTETPQDASRLTREIDEILSEGGFKVKGWISNVALDETREQDPDKHVLGDLAEEKVLGAVWNHKQDTFSYRTKVEIKGEGKNLTKRIILSQIAQIFDPIGFTAPFVIRAKIGLQKLWEAGYEWDVVLPDDCQTEWRRFFQEMGKLQEVKLERCLTPNNVTGLPTLCIFCDASLDAFGACAYLRWETINEGYQVRFVAARSRVAPLKQLTVPRLELQAAVLASRLYKTIKDELTISFSDVVFMTDSMIVLAWIKSSAKRYKIFVATRVGEIQSNTDPSQWKHIPGEMNIADALSRGLKADELKGVWQYGPSFLRQPKSKWPVGVNEKPAGVGERLVGIKDEKRKEHSVLVVSQSKEELINCEKFSSWRRLVRVTSNVLKFVEKLKARCRKRGGKTGDETSNTLTPEELQRGETYLIKAAQTNLKERLEKGQFKALSPFIDNEGIVRVGGRINRANIAFEVKHPILLPYEAWISTLITRNIHEIGHGGVAVTTGKVRRKYWIVKGHKLAKTIKYRCAVCRAFEHKTETQEMSELPEERLAPKTPPFHFCACDYFGPLTVKMGRNKVTKHYGVIFTCLNTRAVHLELAEDCSTMEFLKVLRRFFAIRGQPRMILSDNGTQFVGAERELRAMVQGVSDETLKDFCAEQGTQWKFITPGAPHQNGCAESLVKSCKYALKKAIGEQVLTPFELYTYLLEVANLVNPRPIGRIPTDPDDGTYLCPNDMLLGRASSHVAQGPFRETRNPRHRVELVQRTVDSFWQHWTRDVLPLLTPRRKWNVDRRNICVDDIVMLADANVIRGKWTIARVIEVYPGKDGKVRNIKVKTMNHEYRRPVTKIAVIVPAEGYDT